MDYKFRILELQRIIDYKTNECEKYYRLEYSSVEKEYWQSACCYDEEGQYLGNQFKWLEEAKTRLEEFKTRLLLESKQEVVYIS